MAVYVSLGAFIPTPTRCDASGVAALLADGRYDQAEALARSDVETLTSAPDAGRSLDLADALDALADALVHNGRIAGHEAEGVARRALAIRAAALGPDHPATAWSLARLGSTLLSQGLPREADALLQRSATILRAAGDEWAGPLVTVLAARAEAQLELVDYESALAILDEATARLGPYPEDQQATRGRLLDLKALALQIQGDFAGGASAAREAIRGRDAGALAHPGNVVSYLLLGDSAWDAGRMTEAREQYQSGVDLAARSLRTGHPLQARALARLANWEANQGAYLDALGHAADALALARASLGPEHPRIADHLTDSANARLLSGDAAGAIAVFQEALQVSERAYERDSIAAATPIYNLSLAYAELRDWRQAGEQLQRVVAIWRRFHPETHRFFRRTYQDWGDVLAGGDRDAEAVEYYERALRLRLAADEGAHPATASLRGRLAAALERLGRNAEADAMAAQAEHGLRGRAGWRDREYAEVLALRARLAFARTNGNEPALRWAVESDGAVRRNVRSTVRFLGERQALSYVGQRFEGRDVVLSLLASGRRPAAAARAGLELVARSRSLVLDEIAARSQNRAGTPAAAAAWRRLVAARERLASMLYRRSYRESSEGEAALQQAQAELDEAERATALVGAAQPREEEFEGDLVDALLSRLDRSTALVSFCVYRRATKPGGADYLAFVLREGKRDPAVVALGDAASIDDLVRRWHEAVEQMVRMPDSRSTGATLDALGRQLGARLWTPLQRALKGATRVVLVPDGSLNLVNFTALVDSSGRYVLESGPTLHLVSAERDLLRDRAEPASPSLLIAADPAFDDLRALARAPRVEPAGTATAYASARDGGAVWRGASHACSELGQMSFVPLPASAAEAADLRSLWQDRTHASPTLLRGAEAGEAALKSEAPTHTIVHIASHGFVLDSACAEGLAARSARDTPAPRLSPLLLAGVALAGANRRREATPNDDDGILTAEEIASLDLGRVDWVVLSGCDTGKGEIRNSEGVLGLRRAFAVAGARTVIMSLWPVEDDDAREWMVALYKARLEKQLDTAESVRAASRAVLRQLRAKGASTDPSRWAAFVAAGDWR